MSVDDWARREADSARGPDIWTPAYDPTPERQAYFEGIVHAFDALLSDEAVEAVSVWMDDDKSRARIALQAAVRAVTEGDTK